MLIKQNSIGMALTVALVENSPSYAPTGALSLFISKNGAPFAAAAGSASYSMTGFSAGVIIAVNFGSGDDDTLGSLVWYVADSGTSIVYVSTQTHQVVSFDPNDATALGLTKLTALVPDPWVVPLPGAYGAGTAGLILGNLGTSSDPWNVTVPGAYAAGKAGYVLGNMALAVSSVVLSLPNSIDAGLTLAQAVKLMTAVLCGVSAVSGFVVTYFDTTDSIARVVATLDGTGQRTTVTYNKT